MLPGRGGTNTSPFTKTQMKKSHGERSGDRGKMATTITRPFNDHPTTVTKKHATASLARARIPTRPVQSHRRRSY